MDPVDAGAHPPLLSHMVPFDVGDRVQIQEKCEEWYRGVLLRTGEKALFPAPLFYRIDEQGTDPFLTEVRTVMREWNELMRSYYEENRLVEFKKMRDILRHCMSWHKIYSSPLLSGQAREDIRGKLQNFFEESRRAVGLDLVVRLESGAVATAKNMHPVSLLRRYQEMQVELRVAAPAGMGGVSEEPAASPSTPDFNSNRLTRQPAAAGGGGSPLQRQAVAAAGWKSTASRSPALGSRQSAFARSSALTRSTEVIARATTAGAQADDLSLLLDFKAFVCPVGEPVALYFSLFDNGSKQFLSEEWSVDLSAQGMPVDIEMMGKLRCVFPALPVRVFASEKLYLVCRVIRLGKLQPPAIAGGKSTRGPSHESEYRRPYGCAIVKLASELRGQSERELRMNVFMTSSESFFANIHDLILMNQHVQPIANSRGITIGVECFCGAADVLNTRHPEYFAAPRVSLFDPTQQLTGTRNDMFVTLQSADLSLSCGKVAKQAEVVISVRDGAGNPVEDCIVLTAGAKPVSEYRAYVVAGVVTPLWNETFLVRLPPEKLLSSHLLVLVLSATGAKGKSQELSLAVMRFGTESAAGGSPSALPDGSEALPLLKFDKKDDRGLHLLDAAKIAARRVGPKEVIKVHTRLMSTQMTQNPMLAALLNWEKSGAGISDTLRRITFVDSLEIGRFLGDTIRSFFAMFLHYQNNISLQLEVYSSFVYVVGTFVDERLTSASSTHLMRLLAAYESATSPASSAPRSSMSTSLFPQFDQIYAPLLHCCAVFLGGFAQKSSKDLTPTVKVLEFIIRFAIASAQKNASSRLQLVEKLTSLMTAFCAVLSCENPQLIGLQVLAVKSFGDWCFRLEPALGVQELARVILQVFKAIVINSAKAQLAVEKIAMIRQVLNSPQVRSDPAAFRPLFPAALYEIAATFVASDHVDAMFEVTECLLNVLERLDAEPAQLRGAEVDEQLAGLLPHLIALALRGSTSPTVQSSAMVCCLLLLRTLDQDRIVETLVGASAQFSPLMQLMSGVVEGSLQGIPKTWFALNLWQLESISALFPCVSQALVRVLSSSVSWNELWGSALLMMLQYMSCRSLALESFTAKKSDMVMDVYGDLRLGAVTAMKQLWMSLGSRQPDLAPLLVGKFLHLTLLDQPEIALLGFDLFLSSMRSEFQRSGTLVRIQGLCIDTVDKVVNEYGSGVQAEFETVVVQRLEAALVSCEPEMRRHGLEFLGVLKQLISLYSALRTLPLGREYDDDRMLATFKLMVHLQETGWEDKYLEFVQGVVERQMSNENFVEAAAVLRQYADRLEWSDTAILSAHGGYPAQSSSARRMAVFEQMIQCYDRGKYWERAIDLLELLKARCLNDLYDYHQLAQVLSREADLYRKIITADRFFPEYFMVGHFGQGFPPEYRNVMYVVRAAELERTLDFQQKVQQRWPSAVLMKSTEYPSDDVLQSPGMHLQIFQVRPVSRAAAASPTGEEPRNSQVPLPIQRYWLHNDVSTFVYARPVLRKKDKKDNDFACLWIQRHIYSLEFAFPNVHRRARVVSRSVTELPPLANAVQSIQDKTLEIQLLCVKFSSSNPGSSAQQFTMVLKGVIDAAVNGGVKNYLDAFCSPAYLAANPVDAASVQRLRAALREQVEVLERGLQLHRSICEANMMELHRNLEQTFAVMMKMAQSL